MTDINVRFCQRLLSLVMVDIKAVTSAAERKDSWVYDFGHGHWEFHGPEGFYWDGRADNAYDARHQGWSAWYAQLECDPPALEARKRAAT